jgi:hypothetical protein
VQLVEVDDVRPEPPEAVLGRPSDVDGVRPLPVVVDAVAELRGDHRLAAPRAERASKELLALRAAVDVGRVEERDSGIERRVDHRRGRRLVDPPAEVVAADADLGDEQAADRACVHNVPSARVG